MTTEPFCCTGPAAARFVQFVSSISPHQSENRGGTSSQEKFISGAILCRLVASRLIGMAWKTSKPRTLDSKTSLERVYVLRTPVSHCYHTFPQLSLPNEHRCRFARVPTSSVSLPLVFTNDSLQRPASDAAEATKTPSQSTST